ncbi:Transcription initiation factor IIE subunit alpha [Nosema granulosis]|uniref:Transcription initiation factor IIE subunit alpha n=1 Tax=Nosema granulosis TaxID=83296 RepID=A0A9P6KZ61_9MICR|nr:Transcription initiation factor IIE subunit alpha [Nosema granulosis]
MEFEPIIKKLIKTVVRKFYEPYHAIITDMILEDILLYDSDLVKKMKMHSKEVNRLLVALKEDRILKYENKVEIKEDNRQFLSTVYYINYVEVKDVVKYKIYKITKKLESKNTTADGYVCLECEKEFTALEAQTVMSNFVFKCDECNGDLVENVKDLNAEGNAYSRFMSSIQDIVDLLKKLDKYNIPSMDYFQLLEYKKERGVGQAEEKKGEKVVEQKVETEVSFKMGVSVEDEQKEDVEIEEYVTVGGVKKKFSEVTEEDKDKMNEEEYENYFEIFAKYEEAT